MQRVVPTESTLVSTFAEIVLPIQLNFTFSSCPAGATPLQIGFFDAIRSYPFLRMLSSIDLSLNNQHLYLNTDAIEMMLHMLSDDHKEDDAHPTNLDYFPVSCLFVLVQTFVLIC